MPKNPSDTPAAMSRAIDALFHNWDAPGVPGGAVAVLQKGKLIHCQGYGMADIEKDIPWGADSLYPIMSVSKQFTTACILILEAQGKLNLDDDVHLHLPDLPDYGTTLTLRHLCTNTSGLRDYPALGVFAGARVEGGYGFEPARRLIFGQRSLQFTPGERYVYSNSNFYLLAYQQIPSPPWLNSSSPWYRKYNSGFFQELHYATDKCRLIAQFQLSLSLQRQLLCKAVAGCLVKNLPGFDKGCG